MLKKNKAIINLILSLFSLTPTIAPTLAALPPTPDQEETSELLVIGGGLAGSATA